MTSSPLGFTASDDEEFVDDGVGRASKGRRTLTPVGEQPLPGGRVYKPRTVDGHEDLAWLRDCRDEGEHVLSYGPPGTGKSAMVTAAFGMDAVREDPEDPESPLVHSGVETIVCSVDTTEADFLGTFVQDPNTGRFVWAPGPLHRAVMHSIPIYVDEVFMADPRILSSTLYPLMDGRGELRIPANPTLPPLPVRPGFVVIGSGNPDVPGANFSEALRSRFTTMLEINSDWQLARELGAPAQVVQVARNLDLQRSQRHISWSPQLRELIGFVRHQETRGRDYAIRALIGQAPIEDRPVVADAMRAAFGIGEHLALGDRHVR